MQSMGSTDRQRSHSESEALSILQGTALYLAAAQANGEGVRTEIAAAPQRGCVQIRLFIGNRSTLISFEGIAVARVLPDPAVRPAVEERIANSLAGLADSTA